LAGLLTLLSPLQARPLYIVAIGASNTSGLGVGEQNAYPAVLERLLRQKGIDAHVTNAGVWGDVTAGMRNRLDSAVPKGTDIVILQPGANDLRFFGTKEARTANISAMTQRLHARGIRVVVYDPDPVPRDFYQPRRSSRRQPHKPQQPPTQPRQRPRRPPASLSRPPASLSRPAAIRLHVQYCMP
jgi:lysophospholipase L1-like esterase